MSRYKDVARQMVKDYIELEELTINNNQRTPAAALGDKYNIDDAAAGELWTGVRMGMLQRNNDTRYGMAARQMYEDNIIDNIENMTANNIREQYNIDGIAGKNILKGLEAAQLNSEKIKKLDSNIPDGITAEHILRAVNDFNQGTIQHDFDDSTTYDVIIDDNRYPPKAIIGLASRYILGKVLTPAHFSGGLQTKCFRVLEENGFEIEQKPEAVVYPDEIDEKEVHFEGTLKKVTVNTYERDNDARAKCVKKYGAICSVCKFDFEDKYGDIGVGFIHVHHLTPISIIGQEYHVDPIRDLRPVCPNCHAMLHKRRPDPYTIKELKDIINRSNNDV